MDTLKILIVANKCPWNSWETKIKFLQDCFLQKFSVVHFDIVHTNYEDVPFVGYLPNDPAFFGVEPAWYDNHVTAIAVGSGYDMVLFVVDKAHWKDNNRALGWRTDNEQGIVQLQIMGDEICTVPKGKDNIREDCFDVWARHEITHGLYMLTDQEDHVHLYGDDDAGIKKCLDELVFKDPNVTDQISFIKRLLNGLYLALGLRQRGEFPTYEVDSANQQKDMLNEFCLAIQEHEGYFPPGTPGYPTGSRSWRNKNPGNIRWIGQKLAIEKDKQNFCIFATYEDGFQALKEQVMKACEGNSKVYNPNMTLTQFFEVYAPASDKNFPHQYAEVVAKKLGVGPDFIIKNLA